MTKDTWRRLEKLVIVDITTVQDIKYIINGRQYIVKIRAAIEDIPDEHSDKFRQYITPKTFMRYTNKIL